LVHKKACIVINITLNKTAGPKVIFKIVYTKRKVILGRCVKNKCSRTSSSSFLNHHESSCQHNVPAVRVSFPPHCPVTTEGLHSTLRCKAGYQESLDLVPMTVQTSESHLYSVTFPSIRVTFIFSDLPFSKLKAS
jgi:hypothetical protein